MGDLREHNVSMFEDIKHMDENGIEFGMQENWWQYWNIQIGEILKN